MPDDQPELPHILWEEHQSLDRWARDAAVNPAIFCSFVGKVVAYGNLHREQSRTEFAAKFSEKLAGTHNGDFDYPQNMADLFGVLFDKADDVRLELLCYRDDINGE